MSLVEQAKERWGRVKVDIGCGMYPRGEDFITVDRCAGDRIKTVQQVSDGSTVQQQVVEMEIKADIKAEMWDVPLPDASVDEIWCSHALEHVEVAKVGAALREFNRILKAGGRAIVTVPNFDYIAKYWLCGQDRRWAEAMVMGRQDTPGEFHQSCFNAELLRADMEGTGFEVKVMRVVWSHNQECLQAVAIKKGKP